MKRLEYTHLLYCSFTHSLT